MRKLTRALAICRRVLLLLLLGITLLGSWIYTQMPRLDELRPSIEGFLKQELQLDTLKLGSLSWYWAGFLWIESDKLAFETANHAVAFRDGSISIRVPLLKLLVADIAPDRIRLRGGKLQLQFAGDGAAAAAPAAFPGHLVLDDVDVAWRYGDMAGHLPGLHLFVDGHSRSLKARSQDMQLFLQLDQDMLPHTLRLTCSGNRWLPEVLQAHVDKAASGELRLNRSGDTRWNINADLQHNEGMRLKFVDGFTLPLQQLSLQLTVDGHRPKGKQPFRLDTATLSELHWQMQENRIDAEGSWHDGRLALDARADQLSMPQLWSWLQPLGDADWREWLASMQAGKAAKTTAHVELPWAEPLAGLPTASELDTARYKVQGEVSGADIALGLSEDRLTDVAANVELDESGMHAHIDQAMLPLDIGQARGDLLLPWNSLELHITGTAKADTARLLAWQAPEMLDRIEWQLANSHANFMLRWSPPQTKPTEATVVLQPETEWQLSIGGLPVTAYGGSVQWDNRRGLQIDNMRIRTPHSEGTVTLAASRNAAGEWQIDLAEAEASSDFTALASHFGLPVGNASGKLQTILRYDGQWSGYLNLTEAGWDNLLGSAKPVGTPYHIELAGTAPAGDPFSDILISLISSQDETLPLHGSGKITASGLSLKLDHIKSPFFDGGMQVRAPIGEAPWEIDVDAALLYRKALPTELATDISSKPWALRANIDRFMWNEASLSGVSIQLASSAGSVGIVEAKQIHTAQIDLLNVRSMFALPGHGRIDLRHLSADLEKQQVSLSATLEPAAGGGMRWQGFAEVSGDFGHLMRQGQLSERFVGGHMHALFSGQGIAMREQPWWQDMDGRLRLRVDDGRILEGGTLTKLLAAFNLADLPKLLLGKREDLTGPGLQYDRLLLEGIVDGKSIHIRNVVMRSTAFDLAGRGKLDVDAGTIDMLVIAHPLQNLDALLSKIPLLRDILGGAAHSLMRKVYRMHGKFSDATVESVDPQQVGLAEPGLVEGLLSLPGRWFGDVKSATSPATVGN